MTDFLRDKLQALASELSAEGLPSIARRIDAILDAEQDETAAPEGQPEGSEHSHAWTRRQNVTIRGYVMDPYEACECGAARGVAPAPVPDDAVEALANRMALAAFRVSYGREPVPESFDQSRLSDLRRHMESAAPVVAAHTVAAVDAALAEAEQAIEAQTDADLGCPCQCSRGQRDHAAQIVRALREGQR